MPLEQPTIAILGRPNVGKSTLLNRLCGKQLALTHDIAGLTRDIRMSKWTIDNIEAILCDTAGLDGSEDELSLNIQQKTHELMNKADIILFVVDARAGVLPMDQVLAQQMRSVKAQIIVLANKCEGRAGLPGMAEAYSLGLGDVIGVSAAHGIGIDEIYDKVSELIAPWHELPDDDEDDDLAYNPEFDETNDDNSSQPYKIEDTTIRLAIIGRPNAGKSTLVNHMLGHAQQLVGPQAGITRDAAEFPIQWQQRKIIIIDTAGLRKKARINDKLERLSVGSTMQAVQFCTMAVLVIDADAPLEKQDLTIARQVLEEGRALVLAINKCDTLENTNQLIREQKMRLANILPQAQGILCLPISAKTGYGIRRLREAVIGLDEQWNKRIATGALNRWLQATVGQHPPPAHNGRQPKFRYMTQVKARPPTFSIFSQRADQVHRSYVRYLEHGLRDNFFSLGPPIRIFLRKTDNPYN